MKNTLAQLTPICFKSPHRIVACSILLIFTYFFSPHSFAEPNLTQNTSGQFGPYDYYDTKNTPTRAYVLVESEHFGAKTEAFANAGNWCHYWGDLDYTLRAFPNHPKALAKMEKYYEKHEGCQKKAGANPTIYALADEIATGGWREKNTDYYYQTAIRYRSQYPETHMLYGKYLHKVGRLKDALKQYQEAEKIDAKLPDPHYNLGMLYLDLGEKEKAEYHAKKTYQLGHQSPELRKKLVEAGMWNKPKPE